MLCGYWNFATMRCCRPLLPGFNEKSYFQCIQFRYVFLASTVTTLRCLVRLTTFVRYSITTMPTSIHKFIYRTEKLTFPSCHLLKLFGQSREITSLYTLFYLLWEIVYHSELSLVYKFTPSGIYSFYNTWVFNRQKYITMYLALFIFIIFN